MIIRLALLVLLGGVLSADVRADEVTVTFRGLQNIPGENADPDVRIAILRGRVAGLFLYTESLAFNIGCGSDELSCLGADSEVVDDFSGTINGVFSNPTDVLAIRFVNNPIGNGTVTRLFDAAGEVVGEFQNSFSYEGEPVSRFEAVLDFDGVRGFIFNQ